ncbi:unnamed protein product [Cylindrotheca closterium]|uniref:Uncharacterized protein n=1 Tax=Cylindrotheca closterium TaxID=2856 RepID=A0AAD2FL44_9STRA|nr:unnamed protein product [Cylindrotheca closterium]
MSFQSIIDLNTRTVELIQQQNYAGAIEASSKALRLQKSNLPELDNHLLSTTDNGAHPGFLDRCMLLTETDDNAATAADTFIYGTAICLPPTVTDNSLVSAILIFNSALAYQLYADTQASPVELLLRAKRLYGLAAQLRGVDRNILFQFAVINNSAVIERKIGDKNTATSYFEYLMEIFLVLIDRGCSKQLSQIRGFLNNVPKHNDNSAAAA